MSLKDLFKEEKYKYLSNYQASSLTSSGVESSEYAEAYLEERKRFIPLVDYSDPKNFARFGSAEKYYYDSITTIYGTYPYDGSRREKVLWELSASALDLYIFENDYPRTTGYAVFTTASLTATDTSTDYAVWGSYGAAGTGTYEYVSFNGGPHAGIGNSIYIDPDTGEAHYREDANIYDLSKNRECNLKIGGNDGNTVEFWLKKAAFDPDATETEVIFDIFTTSSLSSSSDYGRLTIEMSGHGAATNTLSPFYVTYMSGTDGLSKQNIGTLTTASLADDEWHHYAFRFKNDGSNVSVDLFVDGEFNANATGGTTVDYVSGTIVGTLGALATHPSGTHAGAPQAARGWGKLSGSVDELRFWKVWRNSKQIQTRWFDQVGGGTNTDDANTHLGMYYKFNEGITAETATDTNVLDYSGRITNGSWVGYSSVYSRNTGSAINESTANTFFGSEFRDPILYSYHPDVTSLIADKRAIGKEYDYRNPSTIYYSLPGWILDLHDTNDTSGDKISANSLWNLTQIIGSYFDNAANMAKSIPSLAQTDYVSGSQKPIPFMNRILESRGFVAPEIFNAIDALEQFEDRDKNTLYTEKISDIKNLIYQNIYNNLTYINKSKGTEKSFRNLIRCFGINDQVYKLNVYPNNVDFILENNYRTVSDKYATINFNTIPNSNATVYQYSSSLNDNTVTFISASKDFTPSTSQEAGLPFSIEANIIFPNRVGIADYNTLKKNDATYRNNYPLMETASLFGMHTADDANPEVTTWNANDYANFIVQAIKPNKFSDKAKFVLTGTAGGFIPELSSSFIDDVYQDANWSFLVSLYPEKYPNVSEVSGASAAESDYIVQFSGIRKITDSTISEFSVTGTMSSDEATKFLASPKRTFIGAHRTNFTGSLLQRSDVKLNTIRVWQNKLTTEDLNIHAQDPNNYSIKNPEQNAYLFNDKINGVYVPNKETLLLHWNFDQVTGSDSSGGLLVEDATSGSLEQLSRYGFLSNLVNKQYTGVGYEFDESSTTAIAVDDIVTAKPNLPEVLATENTVKVMQNDDIYYTRDSRPTFFDLYVEKSPYQNISEEMLKFMSTVVDFNNLIGHGVDRYRSEYKALKTLRQLFFQRTTTPDIDKYIEYFKWFDLAVSSMIQKIAPMSSGLDERPLRNIIESHILERNKYQSKFPTYEFKQTEPEASMFGINELLYPWKEGHAPLSEEQKNNCLWFKDRAERDGIPTSGDANADSDRQEILDVINNQSNTTPPNLSGSDGTYQGSTYALRRFPRPYKVSAIRHPQLHGGGNAYENKKVGFWDSMRKNPTPSGGTEGALLSIEPPDSKLVSFKDCDDNLELNKGKRKYNFSAGVAINGAAEFSEVYKGDMVAPFSLYSSSLSDNPAMADLEDFQTNLAVTNLHHDSYGPYGDVPMQGPFTEKFVGGRPYRHVMTNFTPDNNPPDAQGERLEGWHLTASADALDLTNPDSPRSVYFREEYAKRPVNIKNIRQLTGAAETGDQATDAIGVTRIGNYTETYEVVMTQGRSINNRYLAESDGNLPTDITDRDSTFVSGIIDFTLPRRDLTGSNKAIIVNRFSAPGDVYTMTEGMLDIAAAEYSVYNALPFRNLAVRQPLQELLTDHTNQFGLFSDARTVSDYELYNEYHTRQEEYPGGSSSIDDPGADLAYIGTGSFHKVNRNGRKQLKYSNEYTGDLGTVEIDTAYDNFFVQHQIPQTDVQYAWITASIISGYTGSALYGFEQPDFSNASLASTDLTFATASSAGVVFDGGLSDPYVVYDEKDPDVDPGNLWPFVNFDFVGINYFIVDPLSSSANTIGYNSSIAVENYASGAVYVKAEQLGGAINYSQGFGKAGILNTILTHRQGPYGAANWKLYRKDNHPIVRAHRSENRLSYLKPEFVFNGQGQQILSGGRGAITSVIEPPITSKYKQITHRVIDNVTKEAVNIDHSYMNNIKFFTDHVDGPTLETSLNLDLQLLDPKKNVKTEQQMLDVINYYLYNKQDFEGAEDLNPIQGLVSFTTRETIYPKERYTYLDTHRHRDSFENGFWRDDPTTRRDRASQRSISVYATSPGFLKPYDYIGSYTSTSPLYYQRPLTFIASIWSLDARETFETNSPGRIKSGTDEGIYFVGGALYTRAAVSSSDGAGILQNGAYPYSNYAFISSSAGTLPNDIERGHISYATLYPQYNRRIAGVIPDDTTHEYKFGDTKWEAGEQSGKTPFYDTYDDYVEDIKRVGKDYSIIPEFRISNHMDYYLNTLGAAENSEGFYGAPPDSLYEITGTTLASTSNSDFIKTYSHSDFLRTFDIVNDFYGDDVETKNITLSVDALIKFLPYDGFYPADRTVQISKLFYDSYSASFNISGAVMAPGSLTDFDLQIGDELYPDRSGYINPIWKPLFAPGILYNSIKSGIAVDYPVHVSGTTVGKQGTPNQRNGLGYLEDIPRINSNFDERIPFEGLYNPELYIKPLGGIIDNEPHPSASVNLTASLAGDGLQNYSLAMNNFLASTVDFFLEGRTMSYLASVPDSNTTYGQYEDKAGKGFEVGKEYKMRIVLQNTVASSLNEIQGRPNTKASYNRNPQNIVMYAQTGSDPDNHADYYGSAFGPPCDADAAALVIAAGVEDPLYGSASYEPFTPPYYDGYSHIEMTYKPEVPGVDGDNLLFSIVNSSSFEYYREYTSRDIIRNSYHAARNAMQLSASIDIKVSSDLGKIYDNNGNLLEIRDGVDNSYRMLIQPKWEAPVLDFANVNVTLPLTGSGSVARGMWHQYGSIPTGKGIYLEVQDLSPSEIDDQTLTGSLAKRLGFGLGRQEPARTKIGQIASSRKISEAIVAIPFRGFFNTGEEGESFAVYNINRDIITQVENTLRTSNNLSNTEVKEKLPNVDPSIIEMVRKMKKFVIPPHLDFLNNTAIEPFAMFIFDFEVTLNKNDLSNIWQNLTPNIGRTAEKKMASLPIDIFSPDGGKTPMLSGFSEDTRWNVFKVKQRGINSMATKLGDKAVFFPNAGRQGGQAVDLNELTGNPEELTYSYNWPYDFCSLVELAKIDANVRSDTKLNTEIYPPSLVQEAAANLQNSGLPGFGLSPLIGANNGDTN